MSLQLLGTAQVWNNVTASRALTTTYTNSKNYPIMVNVDCNVGASSSYIQLNVSSLAVSFMQNVNASSAQRMTLSAIVPQGSTYSVTASGSSINACYELY